MPYREDRSTWGIVTERASSTSFVWKPLLIADVVANDEPAVSLRTTESDHNDSSLSAHYDNHKDDIPSDTR